MSTSTTRNGKQTTLARRVENSSLVPASSPLALLPQVGEMFLAFQRAQAEQTAIAKREVMELCVYKDEDGGEMMLPVACILMQPLARKAWDKTAGGIIVEWDGHKKKANEDNHLDTTRDYLIGGIVHGCGPYQQRDGQVTWDFPIWPLPQGSLVLHECHDAYVHRSTAYGDLLRVRCDLIGGVYLPGKWPAWAKEALAEKKKRGIRTII